MTDAPVGATLRRELEPRSRRRIAGPTTGPGANVGLAIKGNELIVANSGYGKVPVFARNADDDVAPLRVIGGPATGFNAPFALSFGRADAAGCAVRAWIRASGATAALQELAGNGICMAAVAAAPAAS